MVVLPCVRYSLRSICHCKVRGRGFRLRHDELESIGAAFIVANSAFTLQVLLLQSQTGCGPDAHYHGIAVPVFESDTTGLFDQLLRIQR